MKRTHFSNRGQALIIFVFALIGLVGMTGLAIDGTHILAERRAVQNAADTAAMAGALAKVNGQKANSSWTNASCAQSSSACRDAIEIAARNRAASNGFSGNITDSTVTVYVPPITGTYSDCGNYSFKCRDYVQVVIETNVSTWFARILGIAQTHNRVEAVALARYAPPSSIYNGSALVILNPHSTGSSADFLTNGSGTITLKGGGVFVNSDNPTTAFKEESGCVNWVLDPPTLTVSVVGGQKYESCPTPPPITQLTTSDQLQFPPDQIFAEPEECRWTNPPFVPPVWNGTYWVYNPGHYDSNVFPPDRKAFLNPGVYCVDNIIKTVNQNDLRGDDVFLYVRPGGSFNFSGGTVNLTGRTSGLYRGYLMYLAANYSWDPSTWGTEDCRINGGVAQTLTGIIYAPNCDVTIDGSSGTVALSAQLVAFQLKVTGGAGLTFVYDANNQPLTPEKRWIGLMH